MQIKVGRVVNLDKDVNLHDLSPLDRIIASATNAYRNTSFYKRRYAEEQERQDKLIRKVKEALVNNLMAIIRQQLRDNQLLSKHDDICEGILLKVPSRFKKYLKEVLEMQEFMPYSTKVIEPSRLLRHFTDDYPVLLYVENKASV